MSTNIVGVRSLVKSVPLRARPIPRLESSSDGLGKAGSGESAPGGLKPVGPGRPRSDHKGQVVSCRLPAEELRAFDALCTQLGAKSRSDGLRSIVRMSSGFLEFSREDCARLEDIRYELSKIGTNVNQIALAANRGRSPMVRAQWTSVEELRQSLPTVTRVLNQIIAERRRQGVALFRKFAEGHEGGRHG